MSIPHAIALVEPDIRRRAAITHALTGTRTHIEPFENVAEIGERWPRDGAILVSDCGSSIRDLIELMTEFGDWLPVVAYAESPNTGRIVQAILEGALGYFEWPSSAQQVIELIESVEVRSSAIGSLKLREARARSRVKRLTRRELEVLTGVADGLSNRLIGEQLSISPRTVEIHRANMLTKMGANHTSEAIRIAIEASLVA
jgi:two-component system, LuxR family, response regulator FixJ